MSVKLPVKDCPQHTRNELRTRRILHTSAPQKPWRSQRQRNIGCLSPCAPVRSTDLGVVAANSRFAAATALRRRADLG
jgi:hypothetical protein